jgi:hypothetical protein
LILLLSLYLAAAPARTPHVRPAARAHPAPALRPEENPKLGGAAKAFARARVAFVAPQDRAELAPGDVEVSLRIAGYSLIGGAHAHLIVDNLPAFEVDDASAPLVLRGLEPGPHVLRAVVCRPWHEVVKARHAFAMVRFWSGPRLPGRTGLRAEAAAWPNPRKPLLTYVLPIGEWPRSAPDLELVRASEARSPRAVAVPAPAPRSEATSSMAPGEDYTPPPPPPPPSEARPPQATAPPPASPEPPRLARPRPLALDFYLSNAHLARGRRGSKVRVVLDKKELQLVRDWRPRTLGRLYPGAHFISIDLLDRLGLKLHNPLNRTDRNFSTP